MEKEGRGSAAFEASDTASADTKITPPPGVALPPRRTKSIMYRTTSAASGPDALPVSSSPPASITTQEGDSGGNNATYDDDDSNDAYSRLTPRRKSVVVAIMAFCAFLSPISSTSVLSATPEVADTFHTNGSVVNASNAGYMVFMGLAPIVWGPMSQVFGRWIITFITACFFFLLSVATALAPNLAGFFVFRALSAFEGTAFILVGAAVIGDMYKPTERGTAVGWFLSGTVVGPAFGPFVGGIIVTYSSWRTIFWLQAALAGVGALCVFFFVPETIHHKKIEDLKGLSRKERTRRILHMINPIKVLLWFEYWNVVLMTLPSMSLLWTMYSILTPIRYVLNPRFHLKSPLLGSLFYLAPGIGYFLGTFGGGRWADATVRRWIRKRNGERIPEDRLRSALPFVGVVMPACLLVYGWSVDQAAGGIAVPVIALFVQGVGQLFSFPALNTYCLDMAPGHGAEIAAANFFARYLAGCVGTAVVLPAIEGIGVGWFSTISAVLLVASAVGLMAAIRWGKEWREQTDAKRAARRSKARAEAQKKAGVKVEDDGGDGGGAPAGNAVTSEKGEAREQGKETTRQV